VSITSREKRTITLEGLPDIGPGGRQRVDRRVQTGPKHRAARPIARESSPRHLVPHTWILTSRILRRWSRDPTSMAETLILPVALLTTLNVVLGDAISKVTGHSALYGTVPLVAMVAAMSGATVGGIGVMRERTDGLLSRLWTLPVHRASGLLSRLVADAFRIMATTAVIMATGLVLGLRFHQGIAKTVVWFFVPTFFGVAFSAAVVTLALYSAKTIVVEASAIVWALLMFFSTGFVPLDQYPGWIQPAIKHQPMSYTIEAMRGLSLGGPVRTPLLAVLLWSAGIAVVCAIPMAIGYRRASMRG
jgi:ABC-2 type transport system permease protein